MKRYGPIRVPTIIAGDRGRRVVRAAWSNVPARSLVSPRLALEVAGRRGPRECVYGGVLGRVCGETVKVEVRMGSCARVEVSAIVAPLPSGVPMVLGDDVALRTATTFAFQRGGVSIACRDMPLSATQARRSRWTFSCGNR